MVPKDEEETAVKRDAEGRNVQGWVRQLDGGMKQSDEPFKRGRRREDEEDEGRPCQPPAVRISQQLHWARTGDNGGKLQGGVGDIAEPLTLSEEKPFTAGG